MKLTLSLKYRKSHFGLFPTPRDFLEFNDNGFIVCCERKGNAFMGYPGLDSVARSLTFSSNQINFV